MINDDDIKLDAKNLQKGLDLSKQHFYEVCTLPLPFSNVRMTLFQNLIPHHKQSISLCKTMASISLRFSNIFDDHKKARMSKTTQKIARLVRACFNIDFFLGLRVKSSTNGIPNSTGILFPTNTVEKWIPRNLWKITFHKFYRKHSIWIVVKNNFHEFGGKLNSTWKANFQLNSVFKYQMNSLLQPAYLAFWLGSLYFEVYNFGDLAKQSWGEHLYKVKNSSLYANHQVKSC